LTTIRTPRLTLSDVTTDDAAFVLELLNDPGWIRFVGARDVHTLEAAVAYITERFGKSLWLVARDAVGEPVGMCGLMEREDLDWPDIGYALLERYAGQGYATEAAAALLKHAQEAVGLAKVAAITSPDNTASQRVLEKIGLRFIQMIDVPGYDGGAERVSGVGAAVPLADVRNVVRDLKDTAHGLYRLDHGPVHRGKRLVAGSGHRG